jgi:lipopolysaccharide transport system ATP-binding protein
MLREALVNFMRHPLRKKQTETIWALKSVSFEVKKGEVVGIIGRNGAGKSTLLKVLSKITYPTSGTRKVTGSVASLLEVGTGFHEELTGRENIYLNGSILGMPKKEIDTKLDAIAGFAGVEKFIDTPVKRYSSGMRLRLGFAVAAHLEAEILLVDEVLAVGDAEFQKKCIKAMDDLSIGGRTVLFVSHNMAAVENLCPRVIWIDKGQILQDGDAQDVIKAYMSTFTEARRAGHDLRHIERRRGNGEIRYTGIEFLGSNDQIRDVFQSGDRLIVRLYYHAEKPISTPIFRLEIFTKLGAMITALSTWANGCEIPLLHAGKGYIDLEIDNITLMPGRYYLTLKIESFGPIHYDILDSCTVLDVESSDFYGSGKGFDSNHGIIFIPCRWHLDGLQVGGKAG